MAHPTSRDLKLLESSLKKSTVTQIRWGDVESLPSSLATFHSVDQFTPFIAPRNLLARSSYHPMTENHCQIGLGHDHGSKSQHLYRCAPIAFRLAWEASLAEIELAGTHRQDCTQQRRRHAPSAFRLAREASLAEIELAGMHRLDCTQQRRRHAPSAFRLVWEASLAKIELAGTHKQDCTQQRRPRVYYMWSLCQYIMPLNNKTGVCLWI
jgi:hypothetical protein